MQKLLLIVALGIYLFFFLVYRILMGVGTKKISMVVHDSLCNGCGNCIVVCPPNALRSLDVRGGKGPSDGNVVMLMKDGIVLELDTDICERMANPKAELCMLCIEACPLDAIEFTY